MNESDVMSVSKATKGSVVAVHMDTVNHCNVTRPILKTFVAKNNLTNILIPDDGVKLSF
ncbi:MAG: hypothetical protein WDO15_16975 [Bacteroidota bacterium]